MIRCILDTVLGAIFGVVMVGALLLGVGIACAGVVALVDIGLTWTAVGRIAIGGAVAGAFFFIFNQG